MVSVWECSDAQLCLTPYSPMDRSPPGFSVYGLLQVRMLEWVAIPLFQGIFLTQQLNPHLLRSVSWQVDSIPLGPPGKSSVWEP